jgi:hypothetical protein
MRKEKYCKMAFLRIKGNKKFRFSTFVKLGVESACGSASKWKIRIHIKTMPTHNTGLETG